MKLFHLRVLFKTFQVENGNGTTDGFLICITCHMTNSQVDNWGDGLKSRDRSTE